MDEKKHRSCGGNAETVRNRIDRLISKPFELSVLTFSGDDRQRIHQELVQVHSERRSEVQIWEKLNRL